MIMALRYSTTRAIFEKLSAICPDTHANDSEVITVVGSQRAIGKRFIEQADGSVKKESDVTIAQGFACQFYVPNHETLANLLELVSQYENVAVINTGFNPVAVGTSFYLLSKAKLESMGLIGSAVTTVSGLTAFARLKEHSRPSAWQLLDRDEDQYTPEWAKKLNFGGWRDMLNNILNGISKVKMLRAHSSSARVLKADGTPVGGGNGHVWIKVADAGDVERTRTAIMARAVEQSLSWKKPKFSKATGEVVAHAQATIIDASVWTPGRLVFAGKPVCTGKLTIIPQKFEIIAGEQDAIDTKQSTFSPLKVFRVTAKQGSPVRIKHTSKGFNVIEENLSLDTVIELEEGTETTVKDLASSYTDKVRCQAPFRESVSMAAFFAIDDYARPFVFDSGTNTLHVLPTCDKEVRNSPEITALIKEYQRWLGNLIGYENVDAVLDMGVLAIAWDSAFYEPTSSKVFLLNHGDDLISLSVTDFMSFGFERTFGHIFHADMLDEAIDELHLSADDQKKLRAQLQKYRFTPFIERMKLYRQAKSMDITIDMFASRGTLSVTDGIAVVVLPHKSFVPQLVQANIVTAVVEDYTEHFTEFLEFLALVLYARFATDRRHAFVWLHSLSSWGKGFLLAIFEALGLVVEISPAEIEKALAGGPVGVSMTDMLRAWILFVDEFKAASSELKLLNRQIAISPKHQLRCTVQLFVKLFASAENVRSLVGAGVEGQFNNRFAYLSPVTRNLKLEDRQLFKELGKATYLAALVFYAANDLNEGVSRLCAMGKVEASKIADAYIERYQQARTLEIQYGTLEDAVDEMVDQIRQCLISFGKHVDPATGLSNYPPAEVVGLGQKLIQTLLRSVTIGEVSTGSGSKNRRKAMVMSQPTEFMKSYIALSGDNSTIGKLQYKAELIVSKLHMRPDSVQKKVRIYALQESSGREVVVRRGIKEKSKSASPIEIANKRGLVIFLDEDVAE